ncbi:MAG: SDR family oxidoreductase [Rhodospirillales bacterium]|nr:SDR family oxidoreductase [Rhodospirillales bacterium]
MQRQRVSAAVLITGAAKRIGRFIALDLAARGWRVAVHYHQSAAEADAVVAEIAAGGGAAVAIRADLSREEETGGLVARAIDALGPLAALVNNASVFETDGANTATRASWDMHMEVNLRAPFVLTQAFARALPAGSRGNVINILDQRVWNLTPFFTSYTVSKAGLWTLTQTLAMALAPAVRVNAVGPGPTLPSARQTEDSFRRQWTALPLSRRVRPEEIAAAIRFILDAHSVTGQMIAVDAGQHLGWSPRAGGPASADE